MLSLSAIASHIYIKIISQCLPRAVQLGFHRDKDGICCLIPREGGFLSLPWTFLMQLGKYVVGSASSLTGPRCQSEILPHRWDYRQGTRTNTQGPRTSEVHWDKLSRSRNGLAWEGRDCAAFVCQLLPFFWYQPHPGTRCKYFLKAVVIFP